MKHIGKLKLYKERKCFRLPKVDILGRRGGRGEKGKEGGDKKREEEEKKTEEGPL